MLEQQSERKVTFYRCKSTNSTFYSSLGISRRGIFQDFVLSGCVFYFPYPINKWLWDIMVILLKISWFGAAEPRNMHLGLFFLPMYIRALQNKMYFVPHVVTFTLLLAIKISLAKAALQEVLTWFTQGSNDRKEFVFNNNTKWGSNCSGTLTVPITILSQLKHDVVDSRRTLSAKHKPVQLYSKCVSI